MPLRNVTVTDECAIARLGKVQRDALSEFRRAVATQANSRSLEQQLHPRRLTIP
jgi:hypothetical protein